MSHLILVQIDLFESKCGTVAAFVKKIQSKQAEREVQQ